MKRETGYGTRSAAEYMLQYSDEVTGAPVRGESEELAERPPGGCWSSVASFVTAEFSAQSFRGESAELAERPPGGC